MGVVSPNPGDGMHADTISTRGMLGSSDGTTVPNPKGNLVFLQLPSIEDVGNLEFGSFVPP